MKNTKKSLLLSMLSLLLCFAMLMGTTYAWFTDEVTSANNKIQTGNLKIDLEMLDKETGNWSSLKSSQDPIFDYDKWEPGYVDTTVLKVENEGSLALKWVATFRAERALSALADVIDVYVCPSETELDHPQDRSLAGYTCVGALSDFLFTLKETTYGMLEAGECAYLGIALKMRETAGNEYQGMSLGGAFDIRIMATQWTGEFDSFDNEYDKDATFEDLADTSVLASQEKTLDEGEESASFNLYGKGSKLANVDVPAEAVLDPTKPVTVTFDGIEPTIVGENIKAYAYDINVTNLKPGLTGDQRVTVTVAAPRGLAAMQVYHNGTLIEDAVYDEVAGTITFKTASFSPYDFTYKVAEVSDLAGLRAALQIEDTTAKLIADIEVDLTKESTDRDPDHAYKSNNVPKYYNGVMVTGKNVGLDLNGHSITVFCGEAYNSNDDVGALFFVGENGSLNITNTGAVETGFIKMKSSIYAVWAPFADPSYVDIYGGTFIGDSYAGDPVAPGGAVYNENSNRALIYAGFGGNINVRGGYFLYNNTPDDDCNRNNGAFNAKDFYEEGPLLTIHEGVYLINKEYRQNPANTSRPDGSYDNYSVVLAEDRVIAEITNPVTIDGKTYTTWYQVQKTYYDLTFMSNDGTVKLASVRIPLTQGEINVAEVYNGEEISNFSHWVSAASEKVTTIPADNTKDVTLYVALLDTYVARYLNEEGEVLATVPFTKKSSINVIKNGAPSSNPESASPDLEFDHWEVRNADGTSLSLDSYSPRNASGDISIYPYYNIKGGGLGLTPVDEDGDGVTDYYTVEAVDTGNIGSEVKIPGSVNGKPVKAITDLSKGWATNVQNVIIKEGVEEIKTGAFAGTTSLQTVELPSTITKIEDNAFYDSSWIGGLGNLVGFKKKPTIKYNGTRADWDKVVANSNQDGNRWEEGLASGTQVICTDGTYTLTRSGTINYTYTWTWTSKTT